MHDRHKTRRRMLKILGSTVAVSALAGCTSEDDSSSGGDSTDNGNANQNQNENPTSTATATETQESEPTPSPTATESEESKLTHEMNSKFVVGSGAKKMQYIVTGAEFLEKIEGEYETYEPSGIFLRVDFKYKNVGEESLSLSTEVFQALSPEGNTYSIDTDVQFMMENDFSFEQVNPELGGEGFALFDVPTGKDSWRLQVNPAGMFSNADSHKVKLTVE